VIDIILQFDYLESAQAIAHIEILENYIFAVFGKRYITAIFIRLNFYNKCRSEFIYSKLAGRRTGLASNCVFVAGGKGDAYIAYSRLRRGGQ